jgi:dolichol-phosphate mannosyltransferase
MELSVVIPAYNEEGCLRTTIEAVTEALDDAAIDHEVVIVNDSSTDGTEQICRELGERNARVRYVTNSPPNGFGRAVACGLDAATGDALAVFMADLSDAPADLIAFYRKLQEGYECVFGTRWSCGGRVYDYPLHKRLLNRIANNVIRVLMQIGYDDTTNAFKLYRRDVITGCQPLLSHHFNLTVELPLKAIIRGYRYAVLPNSWTNRTTGVSKLKIKEMGSRYLFILLYCLLERWLSRRDYYRSDPDS